jgi:hypothetical protein
MVNTVRHGVPSTSRVERSDHNSIDTEAGMQRTTARIDMGIDAMLLNQLDFLALQGGRTVGVETGSIMNRQLSAMAYQRDLSGTRLCLPKKKLKRRRMETTRLAVVQTRAYHLK